MSQVFFKEVECLKRQILSLSAQVEESVILAVKALLDRDAELAEQVIRGDFDVDQVEVEVEEEALKILALHQPVVNFDAGPARAVCGSDEEVDRCCRQVRRFVEEQIPKHPAGISGYLDMLLASRNIERIGDHATNIAEDVVYLVEGVIVRHRPDVTSGNPVSR
jgi:phosphate uptake regulator